MENLSSLTYARISTLLEGSHSTLSRAAVQLSSAGAAELLLPSSKPARAAW